MRKLLCLTLLFLVVGCSSSSKTEKNLVKAPELPEETILENGSATYDEGLFRVSLSSWSELRDGYPTSYYSTLAEIKMADAQFFSGDYPAALVAYEEFAKLHPGHEAMPYVRYQIGNCSFKQYKDVLHDQAPLQTALKSYEQLIEQHPKSEYVVLARRQIDRCKELQAAYERYVADFYARKGFEAAADSRLKKLSAEFPGSKAFEKVQEEKGEQSVASSKDESAVGKIPSAPRMVSSSLLEESHYTQGLMVLKDRNTKKNAVVEELPRPPVIVKTTVPEQNELTEVSCEENTDGAIFTISTVSAISENAENVENILRFNWLQKNPTVSRVTEKQICSANRITIEANSSEQGLTLKIPSQALGKFNYIVLNRPNRVVLTVSSEE